MCFILHLCYINLYIYVLPSSACVIYYILHIIIIKFCYINYVAYILFTKNIVFLFSNNNKTFMFKDKFNVMAGNLTEYSQFKVRTKFEFNIFMFAES